MRAVIFVGTLVKALKSVLQLGNAGATLHSSTVNPSVSATTGEPGSLLLNTSSGVVYKKTDSGSSTNWLPLVSSPVQDADVAAVTSLSNADGVDIHGTDTNDNAAAGYVGEYFEGVQNSSTSYTTSGQYSDITSITLSAGDWDVDWAVLHVRNGSSVTQIVHGVGTVAGNDGTGVTVPETALVINTTTLFAMDLTMSHCRIRKSISGSTTFYLKANASYTVATPQYRGIITARRVR